MDDKKAQTLSAYNSNADKFDEHFNKFGVRIQDIERTLSYVKKDNPSVLELGCGNGRDAKEILKRTNHYLGLDLSGELVRIAKEKNPGGRFVEGDFDSFVFPNNLDVVFAFSSLLHADKASLERIFDGAYEALCDGGEMVMARGEFEDQSFLSVCFFGNIFGFKNVEEVIDSRDCGRSGNCVRCVHNICGTSVEFWSWAGNGQLLWLLSPAISADSGKCLSGAN